MGADIRFFVTGGTGFIGGHLVERLVAEGHEVVALVRSPDKAGRLRELGVTLIAGDLSLFKELDTLPEVDVVVHLAAVVTAPSEHLYESINYAAVGDLLACIERQTWAPKRLLFASSLAAAGPSSPGQPLGEDDPLRPIDAYGDAKARAEVLLAGASFPVTAFRPPVVFGPGDPAFLTLFKAAARGIGFKPAGAVQRLSFVYVADLVDALVRMAADDRPGFRVYFTPSEEVIDTDDLWAAMSRALDRRVLVVPVPRPAPVVLASKARCPM